MGKKSVVYDMFSPSHLGIPSPVITLGILGELREMFQISRTRQDLLKAPAGVHGRGEVRGAATHRRGKDQCQAGGPQRGKATESEARVSAPLFGQPMAALFAYGVIRQRPVSWRHISISCLTLSRPNTLRAKYGCMHATCASHPYSD